MILAMSLRSGCRSEEGEPELVLQGARADAAHGVALPTRGARHFINRCSLGATHPFDRGRERRQIKEA
jgi:hypothetical protein